MTSSDDRSQLFETPPQSFGADFRPGQQDGLSRDALLLKAVDQRLRHRLARYKVGDYTTFTQRARRRSSNRRHTRGMEQPCIPSQRVDACKELLGGIGTRKYHPVEAADISQYRIDFAKIFNGLNLYGWYLHRFGPRSLQSVRRDRPTVYEIG